MMITVRPATADDVAAITEIYNEAILTTTATFDTEPKSEADRLVWFESHDDRYPVIVAEDAGRVVGWASLSRWSDRCAYRETAETSFYVLQQARGRGAGKRLKEHIIAEAKRIGFHSIIARVAEGSDASLHINQSYGFEHVGVLRELGFKFGRRLDVHVFQLMLSD